MFQHVFLQDLESTKQYGKKEIQELATMLSFTVDRMKSKVSHFFSAKFTVL